MAISFVGSNTGSVAGPSALTVSLPAMLQGDMVLIITATPEDVIPPGRAPTTAGYTTILNQSWGSPPLGRLHTSYKFMGATPDPSVTIAASGTGMGLATLALVFRGVDTTTPLDVAVVTGGATSGVPRAPTITPANPNCWVVVAAECQLADTSVGGVSGFTPIPSIQQVHDVATPTGDITVAASYKILTTPVLVNPAAWTTWDSGVYLSQSIALRPLTVSTDFNTVDKGNVTTIGKAVAQRELVGINKYRIIYTGRTVNIPDSSVEAIFVDKYRMVITGKTVNPFDVFKSVTVEKGSVLYRGRPVTVRDVQFEDIPRYRTKGLGSGVLGVTR